MLFWMCILYLHWFRICSNSSRIEHTSARSFSRNFTSCLSRVQYWKISSNISVRLWFEHAFFIIAATNLINMYSLIGLSNNWNNKSVKLTNNSVLVVMEKILLYICNIDYIVENNIDNFGSLVGDVLGYFPLLVLSFFVCSLSICWSFTPPIVLMIPSLGQFDQFLRLGTVLSLGTYSIQQMHFFSNLTI